jgi:hypothetical protein
MRRVKTAAEAAPDHDSGKREHLAGDGGFGYALELAGGTPALPGGRGSFRHNPVVVECRVPTQRVQTCRLGNRRSGGSIKMPAALLKEELGHHRQMIGRIGFRHPSALRHEGAVLGDPEIIDPPPGIVHGNREAVSFAH